MSLRPDPETLQRIRSARTYEGIPPDRHMIRFASFSDLLDKRAAESPNITSCFNSTHKFRKVFFCGWGWLVSEQFSRRTNIIQVFQLNISFPHLCFLSCKTSLLSNGLLWEIEVERQKERCWFCYSNYFWNRNGGSNLPLLLFLRLALNLLCRLCLPLGLPNSFHLLGKR